MQTLYDAAGRADGMVRLASAWHERVLADEVVSHAFGHGFDPHHTQRLAAYWGSHWVGRRSTPVGTATKRPWCASTAATASTMR